MKKAVVAVLIFQICPAFADESTMRAAATVLALSMKTDGKIIVDSKDRAHLDGTSVVFKKTDPCTYLEEYESIGGQKLLGINFNRLTSGYGYYRNELVVSGGKGERQATCFQFDSSGVRCSGSLHVMRPVDENLLISSMRYVQSNGCGETAFKKY